MILAFEFHQHHFHSVITRTVFIFGDMVGTTVFLRHLGSGGTIVALNPSVDETFDSSAFTVIAISTTNVIKISFFIIISV